ncbi:MAG: TetR/AcrR family transcriptional regulator [bacterium]|nr:TetR/AcrR family transcriptional regulator [bacterium]
MPFNPQDPRVKKTRQGMRDAFARLILQKGYDAISIQDIAEAAQTARITFYRHYRDKEELLTDCLNTLYEELRAKAKPITLEGVLSGDSPVRLLYEHIEEQEMLYRILFSSRGTQTVIERLRHHLAAQAMESIRASGREIPHDIPLDIIAYHVASGQIGLAMWWLDQNKPYTADYMARISLWLTLTGLIETMGETGIRLPRPLPDERA